MLFFFANSDNLIIFVDLPFISTGIIALVLLVTRFGSFDKSKFRVFDSISTRIGFAPVISIAFADATKVKSGTITSSPFPTPKDLSPTYNAVVPLVTAVAYLQPTNFANIFSNLLVFFASVYHPESKTSSISFRSSLPNDGSICLILFKSS